MKPARIALLTTCLALLPHGIAEANNDQTDLIEREPPIVGVEVQSEHISKVLYLNRCQGGCIINPGPNDARNNTSAIVKGTSNVSEWRHGDESWAELVQCVREVYAPYDIEVTDVDPGQNFHHEAVVAGTWDEAYDTAVGGVAPGGCNPANNVISFTFANGYQNNPLRICATVAQESAHSYGLEHAYNCADPLTYLGACGRQFFRDDTTPCGEFEARECRCGGSAQNSHRWLKSMLGENSNPVPGPDVSFIQPEDGAQVSTGFSVYVSATHMRGIGQVELLLNGTSYGMLEGHEPGNASAQYSFETPGNLPDGIIDVEIRATNDIGSETLVKRTVQKGEPCQSADTCLAAQECVEGRCRFPPATKDMGDSCVADAECLTGLCPTNGGDSGYCSMECFPTTTEETCPDGYTCLGYNATQGYCWPKESEGGCGCRATGSNRAGGILLLGFVLLGLSRRRRA